MRLTGAQVLELINKRIDVHSVAADRGGIAKRNRARIAVGELERLKDDIYKAGDQAAVKIPVTISSLTKHIEIEVWSTETSHSLFVDHPELVTAIREAVQIAVLEFLNKEQAKR